MNSRPPVTTRDTTTNSNINQNQVGQTMQQSNTAASGQTTNAVGPWSLASGYFPGLFEVGNNALFANQTNPAPTQFIAGPTAGQQSSVSQMYSTAPTLGSAAQPLTDMATRIARGEFLDPSNDPTFAGAASAAIDPVTRALRETVLPGLVNNSITAGGAGNGPAAYGGAALGLNQERAVDDWGRTAGNITAQMANASRNAGMALLPQAAPMASAADNMRLMPSAVTGAAGQQEQNWVQGAINDALQKYSVSQAAPWSGVDNMLRLLTTGGFTQGTGTTASTGGTAATGASAGSTVGSSTGVENRVDTGAVPDMATQWLQGLTGGAGMLSSLFGAPAGGTSAAAGAGSAIMNLLPSLLALSDRRVKESAVQVGKLHDGTPVWFYMLLGRPTLGLMADEVKEHCPEAVHEVHGVQMVDYGLAVANSIGASDAGT